MPGTVLVTGESAVPTVEFQPVPVYTLGEMVCKGPLSLKSLRHM